MNAKINLFIQKYVIIYKRKEIKYYKNIKMIDKNILCIYIFIIKYMLINIIYKKWIKYIPNYMV
jgi:hypothetical protein